MGLLKDMFSSPKVPKVDAVPPPVEDDPAAGIASEDARKAARRRLGMLSLVFTNQNTGATGTPRTMAGGLSGQ